MQFIIEIKNLLTKSINVFSYAKRVYEFDVDLFVIVFRIINDEKIVSNKFLV